MRGFCDLHTHSVFSDGTNTPEEILDRAAEIGLSAVALCDHNTVDGLPRFLAAAEARGVEAVAGAEFSVDYDGTELHLLALDIPKEAFPRIAALMADVRRRKEISNLELIGSLAAAGYPLEYEKIKSKTPNGNINRSAIADAMVEKGYVATKKEAFETLLSPEAGHYKAPLRMTFWEMLETICEIGAIPVLAHPFLKIEEKDKVIALLPKAKARGLVGMECYYTTYDGETTELALRLASELDLKCSGGSDFHGDAKKDTALGVGYGNLRIPYEWLSALRRK